MNTNKVNRVEVIDHTKIAKEFGEFGRVFTKWEDDIEVEISMQDNDRTLKVFIKDREGK